MLQSLFTLFSVRSTIVATGLAVATCLTGAAVAQQQGMTQEEAQEKIKQYMEDGAQQLKDENFEAAANSLSIVVKATQEVNPVPLLQRARALVGLEDYAGALEDIKTALTYADTPLYQALKGELYNLRAEIYLEVGDNNGALKEAQAATKENRSNPLYQFNLGKAYTQLGAGKQGEKSLTRYIKSTESLEGEELDTEKLAEAFRLRGLAHGSQSMNEEAEADLQKSLELIPGQHEVYFIRAQLQLQQENNLEAAAAMREAIENYEPEDPRNPMPYSQAHLLQASIMEEIGKDSEEEQVKNEAYKFGLAECQRLLAALPESDAVGQIRSAALFRQGVLQRLLGDFGDAVKSFSDAIDINPALGEAYFRRGICFYNMGEPLLALADFKQGAAINFNSPRSNLWKARCHVAMKDYRAAIKAYGDAVAVSDRYIAAYVGRGLAYVQIGEYRNALDDFNNAIRLQPTEGEHYYHRGYVQSQLGQVNAAVQSLNNALQFSPDLDQAKRLLQDLLNRAGRPGLQRFFNQ